MKRLKRIIAGSIAVSMMSIIIPFQVFASRTAFSEPALESENETTSDYEEIPVTDQVTLRGSERNIIVVSPEGDIEIPEGLVSCSITIDGQAVQGWIRKTDENPEYCIFYAINEEGNRDFYRYDLTEKTLQRYFRDPAGGDDLQQSYNFAVKEYQSLLTDYEIPFWIILGFIALIK